MNFIIQTILIALLLLIWLVGSVFCICVACNAYLPKRWQRLIFKMVRL